MCCAVLLEARAAEEVMNEDGEWSWMKAGAVSIAAEGLEGRQQTSNGWLAITRLLHYRDRNRDGDIH